MSALFDDLCQGLQEAIDYAENIILSNTDNKAEYAYNIMQDINIK